MFHIEKPGLLNRIRFCLTGTLSRIARLAGHRQRQLIVCGYPRGGTSLLYNMLSATLQQHFKFTPFEKYYIHHIHKLGNIASKAPLDINHLEHIDELNIHKKQVAIVIVIRDIRDVVSSKHPIKTDDYFIGHDFSYWPNGQNLEQWTYDAPGIVPITEKIRAIQHRPDVVLVKYEDMVRAPDEVQSKLQKSFDLPFEGLFSKYHEFEGDLAYKYEGKYKAKDESLVMEGKAVTNRAKRWQQPQYRDRIIQQFEACPQLLDILIEFGYESDKTWFERFKQQSPEPSE